MQRDKIMTAEKCSALIVKAMEHRDRLLLTSRRAKVGRWLRMVSPRLVDNIAKWAVRDKK